MTRDENRQRIKNEALNRIRDAYSDNPKGFRVDEYDDRPIDSQRSDYVGYILDDMERELKNI